LLPSESGAVQRILAGRASFCRSSEYGVPHRGSKLTLRQPRALDLVTTAQSEEILDRLRSARIRFHGKAPLAGRTRRASAALGRGSGTPCEPSIRAIGSARGGLATFSEICPLNRRYFIAFGSLTCTSPQFPSFSSRRLCMPGSLLFGLTAAVVL